MLSYRHAFHAGNFADVCKHATLAMLLQALLRKEKPFFYLDTHAGAGSYDLGSEVAKKNLEFEDGIGRLWDNTHTPDEIADYLSVIRHFNTNGKLRYYPGSPAITQHLIRPDDRMVLCEMHSSEFPRLERLFSDDRRIQTHKQNGYQGLAAFLPPRERRGLVFIDPSYEVKQEYSQVVEEIKKAYRRWSSGIYAIWYPIIKSRGAEPFGKGFQKSGIRKILCAEMVVDKNNPGMQGTGMIIINPPWQLKESLETLLPWLTTTLEVADSHSKVEWLVEE